MTMSDVSRKSMLTAPLFAQSPVTDHVPAIGHSAITLLLPSGG